MSNRSPIDTLAHGFGRAADAVRRHPVSVTAIEREEAAKRAFKAKHGIDYDEWRRQQDDYGMLAQITGLPREVIQQRWGVLRRLIPTQQQVDNAALWWDRLNTLDKVMMILQPGQPLLRDFYVARRAAHNSEEFKAFKADPANRDFLQRYYAEGIVRGTPAQEQFIRRMGDRINEAVRSGAAYKEFQGSSIWRQGADDFITSVPYMLISPLGLPMRAFTTVVAAPVGRAVSQIAGRLVPGVARQFMRQSAAHADILARKVLDSAQKFVDLHIVDPAKRAQLMNQIKTDVLDMRGAWEERFVAGRRAEANAADEIAALRAKHGANNTHFHVVEQVLAEKDTIWREWESVRAATKQDIEDLTAQSNAATNPAAKAALMQRVQALQTQLTNSGRTYYQKIQAVTVDSVVRNRNLSGWSAADSQKANALGVDLRNRLRQLYPSNAPGHRPFYYPEFNEVSMKTITEAVPVGEHAPFLREKAGAAVSATPDESIRRLHQRLYLPEWNAADAANIAKYRQAVDNLAQHFTPEVAAGLKATMRGIALDEQTTRRVADQVMGLWKDAVLIGRLPAWVGINNLGNVLRSSLYLTDNWSRGRFVDPVQFMRGVWSREGIPTYVLEAGISRQLAQEGRRSVLGRVRQWAYNLNSITEMAFRGGIYRAEYAQVVKELTAQGLQPNDITDIASRVGWERVNEYLYDYTNRWMITTGAMRDLSPFLQFNIENVRFWMRETTKNPWLIPQIIRLAEARPELKINVGQYVAFLEKIGIDNRTIDLFAKTDAFDFIQKFREFDPPWVKQQKTRLNAELAAVLTKYADDPAGLRAYMAQHPDLAAYQRYTDQKVAANLVAYSMRAIGAGPLLEALVDQLGIATSIRAKDRGQKAIIPHQVILGDLGRRWGIPGLEQLFVEPNEGQIKNELRRLQFEAARKGQPLDLANVNSKTYQEWYARARQNVIDQRLTDRIADLWVPLAGGQWGLRYQQDLYDALAQNPLVKEAISQGRFAPDPARTSHYATVYGLPVDKDGNSPWSVFFARREAMRGIDTRPAAERRGRQATYENLPEDLQQLISTTDPATREMLQIVDEGFRTVEGLQDGEDRRRFWDSNTLQVRLMRAFRDTRFTDREQVLLKELEGLSMREQEIWWQTNRRQNPEKAQMFEELFPSRAQTFRDRDMFPDAPAAVQAPGQPLATPGGQTAFAPTRSDVPVPPTAPNAAAIAQATAGTPTSLIPAPPTQVSDAGLSFIRNHEGFRAQAYRDPGDEKQWKKVNLQRKKAGQEPLPYTGRWAIGYGHTGPDVKEGDTITRERAEQVFRTDLSGAESAVRRLVKVPINQAQFDALASFAYNAGTGALEKSTLLKKLNAGDYGGAAAEFYKWTKNDAGAVLPGLVGRREAEVSMFQAKQPGPAPTLAPSATVGSATNPDVRAVPEDLRDQYRRAYSNEKGAYVVYHGNIAGAINDYIRQVNPALDPKVAERIVNTIMRAYVPDDPGKDNHSFDPLWIVAIMEAQSGFDPAFSKKGRFGLGGLLPFQANLTAEGLLDPEKNVRALIDFFQKSQLHLGTDGALKLMGLDFARTYKGASRVLGLRPVVFSAPQRGVPRQVLDGAAITEEDKQYWNFYNSIRFAGGNREQPGFDQRWRTEVADLAGKADVKALERLKVHRPDLYYHVQAARSGRSQWWQGRVAYEIADDTDYLAWKHKILGAENLDAAVTAYQQGPNTYRERFAVTTGDMARFMQDKIAGVQRDYGKWEFSDQQDPQYLDARHKVARAMGTGNPAKVREAVKEIRSIYGDDVSGFTRKLKDDSPAMFEALKPYMDAPVYGPDEKLKVKALQTSIEEKMRDVRAGRVEALREAASIWLDPENAGVLELAREHETAWFDKTFRLLDGQTPADSFIRPEEHLPFHRFLNAMQDAREAKDPDALRRVFRSVPEHFRQEYKLHHSARYANDEAIIEGEDPAAWVALKQRRLYEPYKDYLTMNDQYGSYSPEKLEMIMRENPAAAAYLMGDDETMSRVTAGIRARQSALYSRVLQQYQYNPALLNAIPDDGTRYLISLTDPNAKAAFEQYGIAVTKVEFPRVKSIQELYGAGTVAEEEIETEGVIQPDGSVVQGPSRKTGRFIIRNAAGLAGYETGTTSIAVSAEDLARQQGALLKLNPESAQFKRIQQQFRTHQGIVQGLGLVYQGIRIGQQGGGFFEQLPSFFGAAQVAAQAGLFTGPAAGFLLGPTGLLVGGALGLLGNIFGANRQAEEERRRRNAEIQQQLAAESEQLRERLRSIDRRQLLDVEARTSAVSKFLEQPTAITRQALLDALSVPRPTW